MTLDARSRLREDLITCVLAPGQRLKFEELRDRYELSVGTLREALVQLATEGLVLGELNRGFTVAPVSVADLLDITELRIDLESKALTAAIAEGDDAWEAHLVASYHLLQKAGLALKQGKPEGRILWRERHQAFHDALVAACPSQWVLRFRQTLFEQARRYRGLSMLHSADPGRMEQHRQLMECAIARDAPRACALAEAHIRDTARNILATLPGYSAGNPQTRKTS